MENSYTDGFLFGLIEFFVWAKWLMLAALVLTLADLKFGVEKAKYLKEEVRRSRAIRRTLQKISDYVMWIIVAYTFDKAFISFSIDLLPFLMLIIIYGIELESIYKNYGTARGKNLKINILSFFKKKTELIEIEDDKEDGESE